VQLRRVLLLFALVLGLSALVASIAPPPDTRDEAADDTTVATTPASPAPARTEPIVVRFSVDRKPKPFPTKRVTVGSSFVLEVSVPRAGDVVVDELGLRQSADPLTPARFAVLAQPPGGYAIGFVPVTGERSLVGEVEFVQPASVTRPRRAR
jgi:hypothetical protein